MNRIKAILIATLLMHAMLFIAVEHTFSRGSDFQIIALIILWCIGSLIAAYQFRKATRSQSTKTFLVKLGNVALWLIALLPISLGALLLFLAVALNGVDFR
ncbi:hypothetical protein [Shewanella sp. MBTL60-007]|uniref:hypothetical protein n=1 Tax=Shewanella sp. MBTL60-007 TaxID=2815911 RepID=UPI001BC5AEAA|nr:hypothetical protein [Shewanella sp. MBTL60-007]GIU18456.1 hypothetical protein TUM3792_14580 [Shewanella sp. MBTL60-007]